MIGALAIILASLIGSAPAWVGLYVTNRRAISRQTEQITRRVAEDVAKQIASSSTPA